MEGARKVVRPNFTRDFLESFIRLKHAEGWSDAEIARVTMCDRHRIGELRRGLRLPSNKDNERHRNRVRRKTERQLEREGVPTLAALRSKVFHERARAAGWPDDLRPRAVQILNVLWEKGPRTRRQLCDDIGMPWKGSRKSLVSNDPEGSYLAHLVARGLVVILPRAHRVTGKGRGRSQNLYSLPLFIQRGPIDEESHAKTA